MGLLDDVFDAHAAVAVGRVEDLRGESVGEVLDLGWADLTEHEGQPELRQREAFGKAPGLHPREFVPVAPKGRGGIECARRSSRQRDPRFGRILRGRRAGEREVVRHGVHDDRAELHPDPVFELERRLDEFVDGRLLGEGHEHHLAAGRVREQIDHFFGLAADLAEADGVVQTHAATAGTRPHAPPRARRR